MWLAAAALIRPLAWEPPYALGVILKRKKKKKRKSSPFDTYIPWLPHVPLLESLFRFEVTYLLACALTHTHTYLHHFAVQQKLTECCKSTK